MRNDFESNYLAHHGILGQKWGIRRYQNPDGSLTAAGRARYGVSEGKGVEDISTEKGLKNRTKDLNKAIKINNKKQGKEYTKIANNPENFLGLNKKHAKKIDEYSENIKKGKSELEKIAKKTKDKDTEEYNHAKLRLGKHIINKRAGDEDSNYTGAKADEKYIKKYLKKYGGEPYDEDKIVKDYDKWLGNLVKKYETDHGRGSEEDKAILSNKKEIASSMAKEMTSDIKRWVKEGQTSMPESFKNKSDSEIESIISKKLEKNIANYDYENIFKFGSGIINFNIDGISEYSDYQPLTVDYDIKNKKVKNFYYL